LVYFNECNDKDCILANERRDSERKTRFHLCNIFLGKEKGSAKKIHVKLVVKILAIREASLVELKTQRESVADASIRPG